MRKGEATRQLLAEIWSSLRAHYLLLVGVATFFGIAPFAVVRWLWRGPGIPLIVVAGVGVTLSVAIGRVVLDVTRQRTARRVQRLVQVLHERFFVDESGALDPDYRVSIFLPKPTHDSRKEWCCAGRTTSPPTDVTWPATSNLETLRFGGLIAWTAHTQTQQNVTGVPENARTDQAACRKYLADSKIDEKTHSERTWQWASLCTTFARSQDARIFCILAVERKSGRQVGKMDLVSRELQLAASVLTAAWEVT